MGECSNLPLVFLPGFGISAVGWAVRYSLRLATPRIMRVERREGQLKCAVLSHWSAQGSDATGSSMIPDSNKDHSSGQICAVEAKSLTVSGSAHRWAVCALADCWRVFCWGGSAAACGVTLAGVSRRAATKRETLPFACGNCCRCRVLQPFGTENSFNDESL